MGARLAPFLGAISGDRQPRMLILAPMGVHSRDKAVPGFRHGAQVTRYSVVQPTGVVRSPTPSTWPCITSPFFTAPTPDGVPVMMRSPGANSNRADKC